MTSLDTAFHDAVAASKTLPEKPDNATLLRLYALYKQATEGDAHGERPGMTDFIGRAKYDAWHALRGQPAATAQQAYVDLVAALQ